MARPSGRLIGRLRAKVLPDTSDFRPDLARKLKAVAESLDDIKVGVVADLDRASFVKARQQAKVAAGKAITVPVKADRRGLSGGVPASDGGGGDTGVDVGGGDTDRRIKNRTKRLESLGKSFLEINSTLEDLFSKIGGPAARGFGIVSVLILIQALLSPIIGGLIALPGLLAVAGGAAGVLALGAQGAADAFGNISPAITKLPLALSPVVEKSLMPFIDSLNLIAPSLLPALTSIAEAIEPIATELGAVILASERSGQLGRIFDGIATALDSVGPLLGVLVKQFLALVEFSLPFVPPLLKAITAALIQAEPHWQALVESGLLDRAFESFLELLTQLIISLPYLIAIFITFSAVAQASISLVIGVFRSFWALVTAVIDNVSQALVGLQFTFTGVGSVIGAVWGFMSGLILGIINGIIQAVLSLAANVADSFARITGRGKGLGDSIRRVGERIRRVFSDISRRAGELAGEFGRFVDRAISYVQDLPGRLLGILNGMVSRAFGASSRIGKAIIDGLVGALTANFVRVQNSLQQLTNSIPRWKGPLDRDYRLLKEPADTIVDGFVDRLEARFPDIRRVFGDFPIDVNPGMAEASVGGVTQNFYADPSAAGGFVRDVSTSAFRETTRAINLGYRRR